MNAVELQSKTIDFLRFPLIVGVVFIHAQFTEVVFNGVNIVDVGSFPVYNDVAELFSGILARTAVPLFFLFSGLLFFYHGDFTWSGYVGKLRKRVKTLLIPYLFWNILVIFLFFLAQMLLPSLMSGGHKLIQSYTFSDWILAFWNGEEGRFPICYQFWFIRDLMVAVCISPLIYVLVKYIPWLYLSVLGGLWVFDVVPSVPGFSISCLFFFSLGAWFGVKRHNLVILFRPFLIPVTILYPLLCVAELWKGNLILHQINILVGMVLLIALCARMIDAGRWKTNGFLSSASFFIFAYHAMPLSLLGKLLIKWFPPQSDWQLIGFYFLRPFIILVIGLLLYYLLNKYIPAFTRIITGNRNYTSSKHV